MGYSFENLSDMEFTELVRDLLNKREGKAFSISPEGADGGIDMLCAGTDKSIGTVVQCKRYIKSSKATLLRNLKAELAKVQRIQPRSYLLAVSKSLTPDNKLALTKHFKPYIRSVDNILGAEEINSLLRDYPEVEFTHYKLWLRSSEVLRKLLSEGTGVWHDQLRAEIEDNSKVYVQTPAFRKATEILDRHGIIVISGAPGIGKSTLAQMLVANHLKNGFKFFEFESLEADPRFIPDHDPVIIYFDDFLGRSVRKDNADAHSEKRLQKLIDLVERNQRLRLVLTTRHYLLENARTYSDVGNSQVSSLQNFVLEISEYSKTTRAKVLYNHLFFRGVDAKSCKSLTVPEKLQAILCHPNFSPRIIEWVCKDSKASVVAPEMFADHVLQSLQNPDKLYRSLIESRISEAARDVLFSMVLKSTRGQIKLDSLQSVVNEFRFVQHRTPLNLRQYHSTLKELESSLIRLGRGYGGVDTIQFLNPGVEDTLKRILWEWGTPWLDLISISDWGEDLYALALCVPGISTSIFPDTQIELKRPWYGRWKEIASQEPHNSAELLEGLAKCQSLNIWSHNIALYSDVVQKLEDAYQAGYDGSPNWSLLARVRPKKEVPEALEKLPWFKDAFDDSVKDAIDEYGFRESREVFEYLSEFGSLGTWADRHMDEAAQDRCDILVRSIYEEEGELFLMEDEYEELVSIVKNFHINPLRIDLDQIRVIPAPPTSRERQHVASPIATAEEESDETLLAMFKSLSEKADSD
ncbi:MAG: restriction endonuclease [Armatimonadetes bacterium]|nr:restriction endonuclease [Armatimonadota bacterium]